MTKRPPKDSRTSGDDGSGPYKVGPGRPPLETRFQKGQSGNPGGRKKDAVNYAAVLQAVLEQPVDLKSGAQITALEAILRVHVKNGLAGNRRAIEDLLDRLERIERRRAAPQADADDTEEDDAILERALRRRSNQAPRDDDGSRVSSADGESDDDAEAGDD